MKQYVTDTSGIGAVKRIRHLIPQATLHLIYNALIQPHLEEQRGQKLRNRAARVLTYANYDRDEDPLLLHPYLQKYPVVDQSFLLCSITFA